MWDLDKWLLQQCHRTLAAGSIKVWLWARLAFETPSSYRLARLPSLALTNLSSFLGFWVFSFFFSRALLLFHSRAWHRHCNLEPDANSLTLQFNESACFSFFKKNITSYINLAWLDCLGACGNCTSIVHLLQPPSLTRPGNGLPLDPGRHVILLSHSSSPQHGLVRRLRALRHKASVTTMAAIIFHTPPFHDTSALLTLPLPDDISVTLSTKEKSYIDIFKKAYVSQSQDSTLSWKASAIRWWERPQWMSKQS